MANHPLFEKLIKALQGANDLGFISGLLHWDESTNLPKGAQQHRAELSGRNAARAHAAFANSEVGDAIAACEGVIGELPRLHQLIVRRLRDCFDRSMKLSSEFVGNKKKIT